MDRHSETLHRLLCRILEINNVNELEMLKSEYINDFSETVWNDIEAIANRLIKLQNDKENDVEKPVLTEQEKSELTEVMRIIDENLLSYHFQPIVNAVDGEIYSYEALMRPQSNICPSPFHVIKYAEYAKRLDDIERATFLNILCIIDSRKADFGGRLVFINSIPKTKISGPDAELVAELVTKHSDTVVIEMTEQAEINTADFDKIKEFCRRQEIRIAIDDYGTGYSNIQNLLRYMPNYVKIDRSLISDIENDRKKRHFVREIIEFCHDNGILSLAEGVETSEELRTVIRLGIDLVQGYYTSRPSAEIKDAIPYEIRQEIKQYCQERRMGKNLHIYSAENSERIMLDNLIKHGYQSILIGKNGNGDVAIVGSPGKNADIHIEAAKDFKGIITLENVELSGKNGQPCLNIGENADVRLVFVGSNHFNGGGICVPESARLVCSGEGTLSILINGSGCYGIGNDLNSRHGELIFEQGVQIENLAVAGICIGSGLGGKIRVLRGQFILKMQGNYGVGIGAFNADTELDLFACDVSIDASMLKAVGIGSLDGSCSAYIHSALTNLHILGVSTVGIGTLSGKKCSVEIREASTNVNVIGDHCAAVASLDGETDFKLVRAGIHVTAEGAKALAIGGFSGNTNILLENSDSYIRINSDGVDYKDYINKDKVEKRGGRVRFIFNDVEITD
ncbi:MAG: EAL domain-containing protein [Oscillospiraceae bacterium]|nr:EAL domain-containing protein [Oscillospiraceae bacterium]